VEPRKEEEEYWRSRTPVDYETGEMRTKAMISFAYTALAFA
jgi:hypothetical protein